MKALAVALALFAATPAIAAPDKAVAALMAEAQARKTAGDKPGAFAKGRAAVALAERRDEATLYAALETLSDVFPSEDLEGQFQLYDRIAGVAARVKGPESYPAQSTLAGRNVLALFLGKPGATLDAIAVPLAKAAPIAPTDKDRADTAGLAMLLAQFYDNAGQHARALETAAIGARLYDTTPAVLTNSYAVGLTTLARTYASWNEWAKSLDAADRALAALAKIHGRPTEEYAPPLIHRGTALMHFQRYAEAEAAYRQAIAVADAMPGLAIRSSALNNLGNFYAATGRDDLAVPLLQRAADLATELPPGAPSRVAALNDLHGIAIRHGDYAEALRLARLMREDIARRTFKGSQQHAATLIALAAAATATGGTEEAGRALDEADAILVKAEPAGGPRHAEALLARGRLALRAGDVAGGTARVRDAVALYAARAGTEPAILASTRATLAQALSRAGDWPGAWDNGRRGADAITALIVARSTRGDAPPQLVRQEALVYDTALDAAWGVARGG